MTPPSSGNDNLENEQDAQYRQARESNEGKEADLTEVAAPTSANANPARKEYFEDSQRRAEFERSRQTSEYGHQHLTELAAPAPLDDGSASSSNTDNHQSAPNEKSETKSWHDDQPSRISRYSSELFIVCYIIFFSFFGTLARLGVEALNTYPGSPSKSTVIWANLGGSLFMGFLIEDRKIFRAPITHKDGSSGMSREEEDKQHAKFKKGLPLYLGLTTGFCGSFTSFSTFITDAFKALTNDLSSASTVHPFQPSPTPILPRNGGFSFMACLAILITQPSVSFAGFVVGAHLARATQQFIITLPASSFRRTLDPAMVVLAIGCWIGTVLLAIWPPVPYWRHRAVFPLVFSPVGALTRFYLSKQLNGLSPQFPVGTFVANIFGTCIEGMCFDLQHTVTAKGNGSVVACTVLTGIMDGYCGCLTTVSTWMAELNTLKLKHRYVYGFITIVVAVCCQIIIMGSVGWSHGYGPAACEGDAG